MIIDQLSIFVNGEKENRRGKKLYEGDVIEIEGDSFELILEMKINELKLTNYRNLSSQTFKFNQHLNIFVVIMDRKD